MKMTVDFQRSEHAFEPDSGIPHARNHDSGLGTLYTFQCLKVLPAAFIIAAPKTQDRTKDCCTMYPRRAFCYTITARAQILLTLVNCGEQNLCSCSNCVAECPARIHCAAILGPILCFGSRDDESSRQDFETLKCVQSAKS